MGGNGSTNTSFQCLPSTQVISVSKVCNGVKDCANGVDELDCGSCMFKDPNPCGFHESVPGENLNLHSSKIYLAYSNILENNDPKGYEWRFGNYTTGPKAGPHDSPNFIIARAYRYSRYIEDSELYSPKIPAASAGMFQLKSYQKS